MNDDYIIDEYRRNETVDGVDWGGSGAQLGRFRWRAGLARFYTIFFVYRRLQNQMEGGGLRYKGCEVSQILQAPAVRLVVLLLPSRRRW